MGEREMNTNIKGTPDNGINVGALREFADQVAAKPAAGIATFGVVTTWEGGTRTRARTDSKKTSQVEASLRADSQRSQLDAEAAPSAFSSSSVVSRGSPVMTGINPPARLPNRKPSVAYQMSRLSRSDGKSSNSKITCP